MGFNRRSKGLAYFLVGSQEWGVVGEIEMGRENEPEVMPGVPEITCVFDFPGQTPSPPIFPPMLLLAPSSDVIHF